MVAKFHEPPVEKFDEAAALDAIAQWSRTKGEHLLRVVAPLYSEGPRHPVLFGTGVLVRAGEIVFLVTAAHVVDQVERGPHYFGAGNMLLPLPTVRMTCPLPPSGSREDDEVDVGYWILDPEQISRLTSADTLHPGDLELTEPTTPPEQNQFYLSGFPASRQPRAFKDQSWEVKDFGFITDERSLNDYAAVARDRQKHIFVDFDKSDVYRAGERVDGPNLEGVSGGALWHVRGEVGVSPQQPLLAGIVTTWRKRDPKGVSATRIRLWAVEVARQFPSAAQAFQRAIERRTI